MSKRRSLPVRRTQTGLPTKRAYLPPPEPEDALIQHARRLPLSGPGIVTSVPLSLLPAWLQLHHLEPLSKSEIQECAQRGIRKPDGVALVKRTHMERKHEPNHSG